MRQEQLVTPIAVEVRTEADSLQELARKINARHGAVARRDLANLEDARDIGRWLTESKQKLKREQGSAGRWLEWLAKNVEVSQTRAKIYVLVANNWEEVKGCKSIQEAEGLLSQKNARAGVFPETPPAANADNGHDNYGDQDNPDDPQQPPAGRAPREPSVVRANGGTTALPYVNGPPGPPTKMTGFVTLEQWGSLDQAGKSVMLREVGHTCFNSQGKNENIEWASWSWNPVTGCLHDCPYCYARDIAERFYEQKFAPSLWPARLGAPQNTKYPAEKISQEPADSWRRRGLGNVFVSSMADLFGRWVPQEWIETVLERVRAAPQWTFLFLTKFPLRMAEFDFPQNAWVGTTVDCQARVANAEKAFQRVRAGVKWLSCEPLIEPLKFKSLDAFDWLVIGGASPSSRTPRWYPPWRWLVELREEAARCAVPYYEKSNLGIEEGRRVRGYPGEAPHEDPVRAPEGLRYLPEV